MGVMEDTESFLDDEGIESDVLLEGTLIFWFFIPVKIVEAIFGAANRYGG
jgi:hypothetical protein